MSPEKESIRFGRYELLERLAIGGMAELYRAVLNGPYGFRKVLALKKILPYLNEDARFRNMFLHESWLMAALNHRNLVQVFELGEENGELYLCLELVDGCDLSQIIAHCRQENRPIDPALAAWMALEICCGLDYVHQLKDAEGKPLRIIHRDVNPQNVLLSQEGDVKLGDFGIAKSIIRQGQTQQGQVRGKLEYLSPEQARGEDVGPTSDLYCLGLILFELLALERFLPGGSESELLASAASPPPKTLPADVSRSLQEIVQRMLRPNPESRYSSASDLARELALFLRSQQMPLGHEELARLVQEVRAARLATSPAGKPSILLTSSRMVSKPRVKSTRSRWEQHAMENMVTEKDVAEDDAESMKLALQQFQESTEASRTRTVLRSAAAQKKKEWVRIGLWGALLLSALIGIGLIGWRILQVLQVLSPR